MRLLGLFLVVLVAVPMAGAQSIADQIWGPGEEGRLERWRVAETNIEDPSTSHMFSFTWFDFSPYENAIPQSILFTDVRTTYTFSAASDGTWNVTLEMNKGIEVTDCYWHVTTLDPGGFLGDDLPLYPNFPLPCSASVVLPENEVVTVWINRTVLSGTPDEPVDEHVVFVADRGDFIVTSQPTNFEALTGVTGVEFLVFLAVITMTVVIWSRSRDELVQMFCGVLLIFFSAIAILLGVTYQVFLQGWIAFGAVLGLLGVYLIVRQSIEWITENRG